MPTPRAKEKWDSQYQHDFRPRRYPRQLAKRPTSGTRRNNPHPVKDFLVYNRHRPTAEQQVHSILRAAIIHSAPVIKGRCPDVNSIPVGPLPRLDLSERPTPVLNHWPPLPQTDRPRASAKRTVSFRAPNSARNASKSASPTGIPSLEPPTPENTKTNMAKNGERNVIMNRGLSPRRAAPPRIPGRTMQHYGSFGNREDPNPYIGGLDLYANPYNANRGFNQGFTDYSSRERARESRPMHRHATSSRKGEDYLHNNSVYYSTTPNVTGYFIIHPDWVSERLTLRRSQSLLSF